MKKKGGGAEGGGGGETFGGGRRRSLVGVYSNDLLKTNSKGKGKRVSFSSHLLPFLSW